jgi:desumoylating isopeptidase 1
LTLGTTEIPEEMFMELLRDLSPRFTQETYNVLTNNCNNFTNEVAELLLGVGIPKDIVDLPQNFLQTPLGRQMAPMMESAQ